MIVAKFDLIWPIVSGEKISVKVNDDGRRWRMMPDAGRKKGSLGPSGQIS